MDTLVEIVERIEERLELLGLNPSEASKMAGLSGSAIYNMQRGAKGKIKTKGVNATTLGKLAPVLRTTVNWLVSGVGSNEDHIESSSVAATEMHEAPPKRMVRVVGYVGAGSEAHYYALADEDYTEVEAPPGATDQTVAVEIRGKSFGPLMDTWLVFYRDVRSPVGPDLYGRICVVGLSDDRILIKKIHHNQDGSFTLISNSGDPPIHNAQIEWAAKVTDMRPKDG